MIRPVLFILAGMLATWAAAEGPEAPKEPEPVLVVGQVYWPGQNLTNSQIHVYRDRERRDNVGTFPTLDGTGRCLLPLKPGEYFLMAVADANGDQKVGPGDGLGFHGVVDPSASQPQPLKVDDKTFSVVIPICLQIGADGKLVATGVKAPAPPPAAKWLTLYGYVRPFADQTPVVIYFVPEGGGPCFAAETSAPEGKYGLTIVSGRYYVFAVQDTNRDARASAGDLVAVHGYQADLGANFPTAEFTAEGAGPELALDWKLGPQGMLQAVATAATGPRLDVGSLPGVLLGRTPNWPERATAGLVRGFRDAQLHEEAASSFCSGGSFALCVPAGIYFVSLLADLDRDNKATAGDCLGFLGVTDLLQSPGPQPLMLRAGEVRRVELPLTAKLNAEGKPEALPPPEK